MYFRFILQCCH